MANFQNLKFSNADYIIIPSGSNSDRPSSPSVGMLRKNSDRDFRPEIYDGSNWIDAISGVILDNCVLYVDAAEHLCVKNLLNPGYSASESIIIHDLSGQDNNGTIGGGVKYRGDQSAGAVFRLNGTSSAQMTFANPNLTNTNFTVIGASRYVFDEYGGNGPGLSSVARGRIFASNTNNWLMGHWSNKVNMAYSEGWLTGTSGAPTDNLWRIYCITGDYANDQYSLYTNNTVNINNSAGGSNGPNGFRIGAYGPGDSGNGNEFSSAEVSFLLAYDTILTASQISYTYNLFRHRFKYLGVAT